MPIRDALGRNHYVSTLEIVEFHDLSAPDS